MKNGKIRVLMVEDSITARTLLTRILNADVEVVVAGVVKDGDEAIEFLSQHNADVVLMDLQSQEIDGLEATRRIMETRPIPVVICVRVALAQESTVAFSLMEVGAVACVQKPADDTQEDFDAIAANLVQTVKLMSEVKVVRRWPRSRHPRPLVSTAPARTPRREAAKAEIVGIGGSTGGPPVLQTILAALPKDFAVPLLIVQHIAPGFVAGLASWLNQTTGREVHVAAHGQQPLPGHVYLAPDRFHMVMQRNGQIALDPDGLNNGMRPSVAHLFESLADVYASSAIGILLTGMGKDGAMELRRMKDRGAITFVQDRETSVVFGMPGEAVALGAQTYVLPPARIAAAVAALVYQPPLPKENNDI